MSTTIIILLYYCSGDALTGPRCALCRWKLLEDHECYTLRSDLEVFAVNALLVGFLEQQIDRQAVEDLVHVVKCLTDQLHYADQAATGQLLNINLFDQINGLLL